MPGRGRPREHQPIRDATLRPGLEAAVEQVVTDALTAERVGSGDVPVLGTPAVLALVERACVAAIAGTVPAGSTSVGTSVELDHLAPTPVGATVRARALLDEVRGRRLRFSFEVSDRTGVVARGRHVRVVVDRKTFVADASRRV